MNLKISKGKTLPVGVDLGSSSVKLVQFRQFADGLHLVAAGEAPVPAECRKDPAQRLECLNQGIRQILKGNSFKGSRAVLSLPAADVFVQHIKVPKLPPEELQAAVLNELQGKLSFPLSDAIVRHLAVGDVYGEEQTKQEVIAVAVSRPTLDGYLAMARRAKLDVIGVNIECFAVVECFARLFQRSEDAHQAVMFVDIGAGNTQVVLSHGPSPVFARNLAIGGDLFDQAVAEKLNIPLDVAQSMRADLMQGKADSTVAEKVTLAIEGPLDVLAGEMTKCLRYYESVFRNQEVHRAIFVGGQAGDKHLCQTLARKLALPAQVGDPFMRVKSAPAQTNRIGIDRRVPQPRWAVAVGLSLGAQQAA